MQREEEYEEEYERGQKKAVDDLHAQLRELNLTLSQSRLKIATQLFNTFSFSGIKDFSFHSNPQSLKVTAHVLKGSAELFIAVQKHRRQKRNRNNLTASLKKTDEIEQTYRDNPDMPQPLEYNRTPDLPVFVQKPF